MFIKRSHNHDIWLRETVIIYFPVDFNEFFITTSRMLFKVPVKFNLSVRFFGATVPRV